MNNKGGIGSLILSIIGIAVYVYLYLTLLSVRSDISAEGVLGERAQHIQAMELSRQRVNTYLEHSLQLSTTRALTGLTTLDTGCGTYAGATYWQSEKKTETLRDCTIHLEESLRTTIREHFEIFIRAYPEKIDLTRAYDILLLDNDKLEVIATPLSPTRITEDDMAMTFYPATSYTTENHLRSLRELIDYASAIESKCIGKTPETCVADYLREVNRQAVDPEERTTLQYGKSCSAQDNTGDRSIVLCDDTSFGRVTFALHIPLDIPFEISVLTLENAGITQNWLNKGQNIIANADDMLTLKSIVQSADAYTTRVYWCTTGDECTPLPSTIEDAHHVKTEVPIPPHTGDYWLRAEYAGNIITSPINKVFVN